MAYTHSKKLLLATSISLALSGCGGGGGGAAPSFNPLEILGDGQRESPLGVPEVQGRHSDVERKIEDIRKSEPKPGSVSQSTNIDGNDVTQDTFSVKISGDEITPVYTIGYDADADGTAEDTITIDTASPGGDVDYNPVEGSAESYETLIIGGSLGRDFNDGRIVILTGSNYDRDDDSDYVAAGLWLYVPDSYNPSEVALGAFADGGTEFTDFTNVTAETATYRGGAFGLVSIHHPSIGLQLADFSTEGFDDVVLTARFGSDPYIDGTITNLKVGIFNDEGDLPGTIYLRRADIGNTGFFKGSLDGEIMEVGLQGNWGGQFYGAKVPEGPQWVTGTAGGGGIEQGVNFNFVATYLAERE